MSNVLLGITGMILAIGLAIAGALYLGTRFQESAIAARSVAIVQIVDQVSDAARMMSTQEGRTVSSNPVGTTLSTQTSDAYLQLVGGGYLRSVPANPVRVGGGGVYITDIDGTPYTVIAVGDNDLICVYANRQIGNGDVANVALGTAGTKAGCAKIPSSNPYDVYIVWERI